MSKLNLKDLAFLPKAGKGSLAEPKPVLHSLTDHGKGWYIAAEKRIVVRKLGKSWNIWDKVAGTRAICPESATIEQVDAIVSEMLASFGKTDTK